MMLESFYRGNPMTLSNKHYIAFDRLMASKAKIRLVMIMWIIIQIPHEILSFVIVHATDPNQPTDEWLCQRQERQLIKKGYKETDPCHIYRDWNKVRKCHSDQFILRTNGVILYCFLFEKGIPKHHTIKILPLNIFSEKRQRTFVPRLLDLPNRLLHNKYL